MRTILILALLLASTVPAPARDPDTKDCFLDFSLFSFRGPLLGAPPAYVPTYYPPVTYAYAPPVAYYPPPVTYTYAPPVSYAPPAITYTYAPPPARRIRASISVCPGCGR